MIKGISFVTSETLKKNYRQLKHFGKILSYIMGCVFTKVDDCIVVKYNTQ
jgi:hypothetical protein